jgi:hypothetical protein
MKPLITLSIILFALKTQAQPYKSLFGQSSSQWVIRWDNLDFGGIDTIYVQKDTVAYGLTWKKLSCNNPWFLGALIREDTITGKVWYKGLNNIFDSTTKLAFDFSLQKGDTFDIKDVWGNPPLSQKIVDTTYISNGRKIIVFKYWHTRYQAYTTFIEGVGCNFGIAYKQYDGVMLAHYLLCSYKDGVKTYSNTYYNGDCHPLITAINMPHDNGVNIFPNPFHDYLRIEVGSGAFFEKMELINSMGQIVYGSSFRDHIVFANLPKGIYYLRLLSKKGKYWQKTITKL